MKSRLSGLCFLLASALMPLTASAEDVLATTPQYTYYTLAPDITTNYVTQGKKIGYLRLQVDLMVADPSLIPEVEHHAPLIRDAIISIIGEQPEARVKSLAGREEIRQACLAKVNELLITETNKKLLTELLFTKYLYQ
ncbi:flagellar basal body-associated protein FliL [Photobacterium aphoticum]|nr:flagellar basal body-associated protein FliL [Photobacterium aphoticum]PSU53372.1 flagellar basal body-associated protein FliL [Photobacterium aphoticum]GAL05698.1 flagellar biosynthesis protein FliL [Photobacterium aphoticum]GHA43532.1 flagellar basal body-associated protein FliL [Photobacterium aphoticum]